MKRHLYRSLAFIAFWFILFTLVRCDDTYIFEDKTYIRFVHASPDAPVLDVLVFLNQSYILSEDQYLFRNTGYLNGTNSNGFGTLLTDMDFKTIEAGNALEMLLLPYNQANKTIPFEDVIGIFPNSSINHQFLKDTYYTFLFMGTFNPITDFSVEGYQQNSYNQNIFTSSNAKVADDLIEISLINASADLPSVEWLQVSDPANTDETLSADKSEYTIATIPFGKESQTNLTLSPSELYTECFALKRPGDDSPFYYFPSDTDLMRLKAGNRYWLIPTGLAFPYLYPDTNPPSNFSDETALERSMLTMLYIQDQNK